MVAEHSTMVTGRYGCKAIPYLSSRMRTGEPGEIHVVKEVAEPFLMAFLHAGGLYLLIIKLSLNCHLINGFMTTLQPML